MWNWSLPKREQASFLRKIHMFITNDKISTNKLTIRMNIKTFLCQQRFALFSVVDKTQTMYKY